MPEQPVEPEIILTVLNGGGRGYAASLTPDIPPYATEAPKTEDKPTEETK